MLRCILLAAVGLASLCVAGISAAQPAPNPTPLPLINVDDMMGMYPQQTVFVATPEQVSAVTLLNHFVRYRIPTNGLSQVSSDAVRQLLFVLDWDTDGTQRLRMFDLSTGSQRAEQSGIGNVAAAQRVLSNAVDGRVLLLKSDASHAWVDTYDPLTLQSLGPVTDRPGCGDRLLTSYIRVAIVCLSTGEIAIDDLRGNHTEVDGVLPNLAAVTIAHDGTLYVATADQQLATVAAGTTRLVSIPWPTDWYGSVLPDGLAVAQSGGTAVIAELSDDGAWLRMFAMGDIAHRRSVRLAGAPQGGVLALWPFAYYSVGSTIQHVDLMSGLLETMAEIGAGAVPGAVVNG